MTKLNETILDQALLDLRSGEDVSVILKSYPEYSAELKEILETASLLLSIEKRVPPTPLKQRRYAETKKSKWSIENYFDIAKYAAIPIILVISFTGSQNLIHATEQSLPGETLFSLKRATEKARVRLTFNQEDAANLEVEITKKRVNETKRVIAESNDPAKQAIAIAELKQQTEKTFNSVASIVATAALKDGESELLTTLVALNKEQKSLTESSQPEENTTSLASIVQENDKTIAKLFAAVNEQTLANLPNKISVTGEVSRINQEVVTVEKSTFIINESTLIVDNNGELTDPPELNSKITVIGFSDNNNLIAKKIFIQEKAQPTISSPNPTIKGVNTTIKKVVPKPVVSDPPVEEPAPVVPTEQHKQNEATTGFIVEPTARQYTP